jgi:hypothetical protein
VAFYHSVGRRLHCLRHAIQGAFDGDAKGRDCFSQSPTTVRPAQMYNAAAAINVTKRPYFDRPWGIVRYRTDRVARRPWPLKVAPAS